MAGWGILIEFGGHAELITGLQRYQQYTADMTEAWERIADDFNVLESRRFGAEGPGWAPLNPTYAAAKAKAYPGRTILVQSGLLLSSLEGGNPYEIRRITPTSAELGTQVPYAGFHQTGTSRMPARPVIQLTPDDYARWRRLIQKWLAEQRNKANLAGAEVAA